MVGGVGVGCWVGLVMLFIMVVLIILFSLVFVVSILISGVAGCILVWFSILCFESALSSSTIFYRFV